MGGLELPRQVDHGVRARHDVGDVVPVDVGRGPRDLRDTPLRAAPGKSHDTVDLRTPAERGHHVRTDITGRAGHDDAFSHPGELPLRHGANPGPVGRRL
ncbi:hypothetical protein GCM10029964_051790 [Kibdelosporangium lantanae]